MVKHDRYSVQLVNAESMNPFPEHRGPDGKDYVEVEPNAEYWIRIHCDAQQDDVQVYCEFEVDGKKLGFYKVLVCPEFPSSDVGIWTKVGKQSTDQALTVKMITGLGQEALWIGNVKVNFYKAVEKGVWDRQPDFFPSWNGGKGPRQGCEAAGKKSVASQIGTKTKVDANYKSKYQTRYDRGALLKSITLHYCTAVGLIQAGVLAKPTSWDYHRIRYPADAAKPSAVTTSTSTSTSIRYFDGEPKVMTTQTVDTSGQVVGEKTFLLYDMTAMDDDSDDSDDDIDGYY